MVIFFISSWSIVCGANWSSKLKTILWSKQAKIGGQNKQYMHSNNQTKTGLDNNSCTPIKCQVVVKHKLNTRGRKS